MNAPPTRPAATVILCRPRGRNDDGGFEVLLVKRHGKSGFMAGAHVFPGGRVDDADRAQAGPLCSFAAGLVDELSPVDAAAALLAGARETQEEAGIGLDPRSFRPWSWWITPEAEPKRFDTRFFLAPVPADTAARIDEHEAVAFAWHSPAEALQAYERGEIVLAPPTLATLEDLVPHRSFEEAAASVARPLPPVCPKLIPHDDGLILALPGDPLHDVPRRAFSRRTRIVMNAHGRFESR
jgi:8-oxo-dGTP pyrophosphatase MutT (NUDIX family)